MIDIIIAAATLLLKLNVLLIVASIIPLGLTFINRKTKRVDFKSLQIIHRSAIVVACLGPFIAFTMSSVFAPKNIFKPAIQIAPSTQITADNRLLSKVPTITVSPNANKSVAANQTIAILSLGSLLLILTLCFAVYRVSRVVRDRRKLVALRQGGITTRKIGRVELLVHPEIDIPFAARLKNQALVFLPQHLLQNWSQLQLVVRHELQHHRQGDLVWNSLLEIVRIYCGWNPLVLYWINRIEENDELACDESLLGRRSFDSLAYATCLFEVAKTIHQQHARFSSAHNHGATFKLAGTAGMAVSPHFLKRRIEMTFQHRKYISRLSMIAIAFAITVTTALAAWAGEGLVSDRRIGFAQAQQLAKRAQNDTGIPIVINKRVLHWLNLATGTPRARFYIRNTLKRMRNYDSMIEGKLKAANLTLDLFAVPAVESGYQNTEGMTSAGIWQFIPSTARTYGLRVDDQMDERLDTAKLTDAAVAYFTNLVRIFDGDWHLALLSYNAGESRVRDIVKEAGHRDVFRMADEGRLTKTENQDYVPKVLATLIILRNPDLVKD